MAGRRWQPARIEGNNLPLAPVRFEQMWKWDGNPAVLMSRATDETGAVQPTLGGVQAGAGRRDGLPLQLHPRVERGVVMAR